MTGKEDGQIFVGGLSWCTTERMLELAFRRFGKIIDTQVITERHTGRSRGFGFVTFSDPRVATSAIACMHNQVLDGQAISVLKAYPKHNAGRDTAYGGRDGHCAPRYGRWERDCLNAGVARRSGRLIFSEFTVHGNFAQRRQGGRRFAGERYDANDGCFHHWGGGGHVGGDRGGYGSSGPDRRGYDKDRQRGRSCDRGGAPHCRGRSASRGRGRRHRSASRPWGGAGSHGREIVTMTLKFSRAIV